jgi:hypothetical protein
MDSFDYDSLDRYIRKFKRNIINKLESSNFAEKDMKNQSDLLCMVLDYSPKAYDEKKLIKKIEIKQNSIKMDDLLEKNQNIIPLNLNKQTSEENSFDSPKLSKLSKVSSIIGIDNREISSKEKENSVQKKVKNIINDIMEDVISINSIKKNIKSIII